ncbi:myb-like DNA-binding domain-containing protein [Cryptosporidium muris RN66]|uniref:Myb-like DNA-binding domain-containing protein n=1 Tax=Cryptosporidium muris (strain RN66) TaxID=441375 RepID=B6AIZ0_CRYMR|nr:myb-like DNA-binding domain-containing protein [Cryptosporidium muris RN66]EEA08181.1 myb-like DNA-binding domain-containing protein [Cryptosporidium muris RN66]|eukprot:XP_002142530.1 myb-like DNA-binding domain-containing protein [Cryptosporidium muris RN66]
MGIYMTDNDIWDELADLDDILLYSRKYDVHSLEGKINNYIVNIEKKWSKINNTKLLEASSNSSNFSTDGIGLNLMQIAPPCEKEVYIIKKIQDEIYRIAMELEYLRNERQKRLNRMREITQKGNIELQNNIACRNLYSKDLASITIAQSAEEEGDDTEEACDFEMENNRDIKVAKKRRPHRRYFRRKASTTKEKSDLDEADRLLRSRTPLEIIHLSSKYYTWLARNAFQNRPNKQLNPLEIPIAQDILRGPFIYGNVNEIIETRFMNERKAIYEDMNSEFLSHILLWLNVTNIRNIDKFDYSFMLKQTPYEVLMDNKNSVNNPIYGIQFIGKPIELNSHTIEQIYEENFISNENFNKISANYSNNQSSSTVKSSGVSSGNNLPHYNYVASVMENSNKVYKMARKKVILSIRRSAIPVEYRETMKFRMKFINMERRESENNSFMKSTDEDYSKVVNSENNKDFSNTSKDSFTILDALNIINETRKQTIDAIKLLILEIESYLQSLSAETQMPYMVAVHRFLEDELKILEDEKSINSLDIPVVNIYRDDIVENRLIEEHLEVTLSIPPYISLAPFCRALCYPNNKYDTLYKNKSIATVYNPGYSEFYHPICLSGRSKSIILVQKVISKRKRQVNQNLKKLKGLLPVIYKNYSQYVKNLDMMRCQTREGKEFIWGCLPLRAKDHINQCVPLPIGYAENEDRYKPYRKFMHLLPNAKISNKLKVLKMASNENSIPLLYSFSNSLFINGNTDIPFDKRTTITSSLLNNTATIGSIPSSNSLISSNIAQKDPIHTSNYQTRNSNNNLTALSSSHSPHTNLAQSNSSSLINLTSNTTSMSVSSSSGSTTTGTVNINTSVIPGLQIKNREREKDIVHQKEAQREWMQTSSSSLMGPSPLWFDNCMFNFTPSISYGFLNYDKQYVQVWNNNNKIEDAKLYETNLYMTRLWSLSEIRTFIEKYLMYPKDFRRIASFLEYKTIKDCISFYYKYKYTLGLKRILKLILYSRMNSKLDSNFDTSIISSNNESSLSSLTNQSDIWNSVISTIDCLNIINQKRHAYREGIVDEILRSLNPLNVYPEEMKSWCLRNKLINNTDIFSERILSQASSKRILSDPASIFRFPVLEKSNKLWTRYDEDMYRILFKVGKYQLNLNQINMENPKTGYILPKTLHGLIAPYHPLLIDEVTIQIPNNIPLILDKTIFENNNQISDHILNPYISIKKFGIAAFMHLFCNQLLPSGLIGTASNNQNNKILKMPSTSNNLSGNPLNDPNNMSSNPALINNLSNQVGNIQTRSGRSIRSSNRGNTVNITTGKRKRASNNNNPGDSTASSSTRNIKLKVKSSNNTDEFIEDKLHTNIQIEQGISTDQPLFPFISLPSQPLIQMSSSRYINPIQNVSTNNELNRNLINQQNWENLIMNQYIQQQILFQQSLQEHFRNFNNISQNTQGTQNFNSMPSTLINNVAALLQQIQLQSIQQLQQPCTFIFHNDTMNHSNFGQVEPNINNQTSTNIFPNNSSTQQTILPNPISNVPIPSLQSLPVNQNLTYTNMLVDSTNPTFMQFQQNGYPASILQLLHHSSRDLNNNIVDRSTTYTSNNRNISLQSNPFINTIIESFAKSQNQSNPK